MNANTYKWIQTYHSFIRVTYPSHMYVFIFMSWPMSWPIHMCVSCTVCTHCWHIVGIRHSLLCANISLAHSRECLMPTMCQQWVHTVMTHSHVSLMHMCVSHTHTHIWHFLQMRIGSKARSWLIPYSSRYTYSNIFIYIFTHTRTHVHTKHTHTNTHIQTHWLIP